MTDYLSPSISVSVCQCGSAAVCSVECERVAACGGGRPGKTGAGCGGRCQPGMLCSAHQTQTFIFSGRAATGRLYFLRKIMSRAEMAMGMGTGGTLLPFSRAQKRDTNRGNGTNGGETIGGGNSI